MKIDKHIKETDKIEIVGQAEKKYELKKLQTIIPYKGHTLFEINLVTGEVSEAQFEKISVSMEEAIGLNKLNNSKIRPGITKKVIVKKDCVCISALNKSNAIKKFAKQIKNCTFK